MSDADPSLAVQVAIVTALKAAQVAGGRIYDRVPPNALLPYVTVGEGQTVGADNSCWDESEVTVQVHVWSEAVGWPEAKGIAGAVRRALRGGLALEDFGNAATEFRSTRFLNDPDGITRHAVVEFLFEIDHDIRD